MLRKSNYKNTFDEMTEKNEKEILRLQNNLWQEYSREEYRETVTNLKDCLRDVETIDLSAVQSLRNMKKKMKRVKLSSKK